MNALIANSHSSATARTAEKVLPGSRAFKVMHVVNQLAVGGTEKNVLKVATKLTEGLEHCVYCIRGFDASLVADELRPEQVIALNLPKAPFSFFVPKLVRAIRECKPDIVHSRNWGAIESVLAARIAGVPVAIHSEHGYEVDSVTRTPLRQRWMRKLVVATADAVFAVSRELRDFHARQAGVPEERVRVLYNGVDTERFSPNPIVREQTRAALGLSHRDFVIGAVGRMVPIKDYDTLIKAASALHRKDRTFKLLLLGDGPELPRLVDLAQNLIGTGGFISPGRCQNVPEMLTAMDVFVQTSLNEGMSNTILEAMATGLPVVATRVGGNTEIVEEGKTGWMFRPGDAEHLREIIFDIATDAEAREMTGHAARQRVHDQFSDELMLENYRDLYVELLRKRNLNVGWLPGRADVHCSGSVRP
ncbi:MAG TPA: glycosyltransferase [Candidatus Angelobacter sp.]